jgi:hypothetical protein
MPRNLRILFLNVIGDLICCLADDNQIQFNRFQGFGSALNVLKSMPLVKDLISAMASRMSLIRPFQSLSDTHALSQYTLTDSRLETAGRTQIYVTAQE